MLVTEGMLALVVAMTAVVLTVRFLIGETVPGSHHPISSWHLPLRELAVSKVMSSLWPEAPIMSKVKGTGTCAHYR